MKSHGAFHCCSILPSPSRGLMGNIVPDFGEVKTDAFPEEPGTSTFVEGVGPTMRAVEEIIRELAQSDVPVLVLAERGAGKRATAQRIHELSRRESRPSRHF